MVHWTAPVKLGEISRIVAHLAASELLRAFDLRIRGARSLRLFPSCRAEVVTHGGFIHGGYWQRGDKSAYSFLAESFVQNGVSFAAINYEFCPELRVTQIAEQVRTAMAWLWHNIDSLGGNREELCIVGHSAGAHIAGMMMLTDWPSFAEGLPRDLFKEPYWYPASLTWSHCSRRPTMTRFI